MIIILVIISAYLIGSIPFAYIVIRLNTKDDIRQLGSGNVGAMNSFGITGKKWIGILVFILDMLKGLIVIIITTNILEYNFLYLSLASASVLLGHNYSLFMKFKGGRGLATAVGVALLISPVVILIWAVCWAIPFLLIRKSIILANIIATILTPVIIFIFPESAIAQITYITAPTVLLFKCFILMICLIIFLKHIKPLKELITKKSVE
jgi:acyl phosphate:glycerol-3-phosphate acyltransferase